MNWPIVVWLLADLHVGNKAAPAPPDWQWREKAGPRTYYAGLQKLGWDFLMAERKKAKRVDLLIADGDMVDGPGEKNSGRELCITDVHEQVEAAAETIRALRCGMVALVKGSRYHVGKALFLEDLIAKELEIPIPLWENRFRFAGKVFSVHHKISKTTLEHTQFTPLARDIMTDLRRYLKAEQDQTDVLVRAHVHRFAQLTLDGILGITVPGFQFESDYGNADCNGLVDIGFVSLEIAKDGGISWERHQIHPREYVRPIVDVTPKCFAPRSTPRTKP